MPENKMAMIPEEIMMQLDKLHLAFLGTGMHNFLNTSKTNEQSSLFCNAECCKAKVGSDPC